jgi:hypothetical protein
MPEQARYHSQLRFSWQKKAPKSGAFKKGMACVKNSAGLIGQLRLQHALTNLNAGLLNILIE